MGARSGEGRATKFLILRIRMVSSKLSLSAYRSNNEYYRIQRIACADEHVDLVRCCRLRHRCHFLALRIISSLYFQGCVQFRSSSYSRVLCPGFLLLLVLVIGYRDPGQNVRYHFELVNAALVPYFTLSSRTPIFNLIFDCYAVRMLDISHSVRDIEHAHSIQSNLIYE